MPAAKFTKRNPKRAALVRALVTATGMTRFGVYKALRERRVPSNPLVRGAWAKVVAAGRAAP